MGVPLNRNLFVVRASPVNFAIPKSRTFTLFSSGRDEDVRGLNVAVITFSLWAALKASATCRTICRVSVIVRRLCNEKKLF